MGSTRVAKLRTAMTRSATVAESRQEEARAILVSGMGQVVPPLISACLLRCELRLQKPMSTSPVYSTTHKTEYVQCTKPVHRAESSSQL